MFRIGQKLPVTLWAGRQQSSELVWADKGSLEFSWEAHSLRDTRIREASVPTAVCCLLFTWVNKELTSHSIHKMGGRQEAGCRTRMGLGGNVRAISVMTFFPWKEQGKQPLPFQGKRFWVAWKSNSCEVMQMQEVGPGSLDRTLEIFWGI